MPTRATLLSPDFSFLLSESVSPQYLAINCLCRPTFPPTLPQSDGYYKSTCLQPGQTTPTSPRTDTLAPLPGGCGENNICGQSLLKGPACQETHRKQKQLSSFPVLDVLFGPILDGLLKPNSFVFYPSVMLDIFQLPECVLYSEYYYYFMSYYYMRLQRLHKMNTRLYFILYLTLREITY